MSERELCPVKALARDEPNNKKQNKNKKKQWMRCAAGRITILYGSNLGTAKEYAEEVMDQVNSPSLPFSTPKHMCLTVHFSSYTRPTNLGS